jgi:hypothetical protein
MRTLQVWSIRGVRVGAGAAVAPGLVIALVVPLVIAPSSARADEPRSATEPRVMMESGEVTNVIDAFDDGDIFDINVSLGYQYASKTARILRETTINAPGLTTGGFTSNLLNVARYSETTNRLIPRVDIGIYKDLAVHVSLPIILSNNRELGDLDGSEKQQRVILQGAPGEQLFSLPFKSPTRSGLEYVAAGLDVNFLNQARDQTKPTWLFGFEGRFSVGTPMHACNESPAPGQTKCADPSDINRNGKTDAGLKSPEGGLLEGANLGSRDPGVSAGTIGLEVHTMMSKRIKYIEPYGGLSALFQFQQGTSDYGITDLEESIVNRPPLVGTMILGVMVIPWENREKFGRVTLDFRATGTYSSEGRDYTELFDAIGSSPAPSLRTPQYERFKANTDFASAGCTDNNLMTPCLPRSIIDPESQKTYTTGLGDVQAFTSFRASASVTWQASEYIKFQLGLGYRHDQGHGITGDQPCNPAVKEIPRSGPCRSGDDSFPGVGPLRATGLPNPNYRPTVNAVGRRFFVDDSNTVDFFASGMVMF